MTSQADGSGVAGAGTAGNTAGNAPLGILLMCVGVSVVTLMNAGVKYLSPDYDTYQIIWARYAGHLAFMVLAFGPWYGIALFRTTRPVTQVGRSLLLFSATLCFFNALALIPLPTAATINVSAPIVIAALSVPLLGERVGLQRWVAIVIGFGGAVVIIQPGADGLNIGALLAAGSAVFYAFYSIMSRRVAAHDSAATSITYAAVTGTALGSIALPWVWQTPADLFDLAVFVSMGFFGGFGHYFIVRAYVLAEASVVSPFNYVQLISSASVGFLLFDELPKETTWIGAAIIVASGLFIAWRERVRSRRDAGLRQP